MTSSKDEEGQPYAFTSLAGAAQYCHVTRQAICNAIRKGEIKAEKRIAPGRGGRLLQQWFMTREDVDAYRASKYNPEKRKFRGERLFNLDEDKFSVLHAAKIYGVPPHNVYYLIRTGKLRAARKGGNWVLNNKDVAEALGRDAAKMETA